MKRKKTISIIACIVLPIIAIILFIALVKTVNEREKQDNNTANFTISTNDRTGAVGTQWELMDVTYDGETHQYLVSAYGVTHWEGCKYCKKNNNCKH